MKNVRIELKWEWKLEGAWGPRWLWWHYYNSPICPSGSG